jgi:hypothetical protein
LDLEILLQQRQRHEAYTSKLLERKFKIVSTRPDTLVTIQPNKASHFVAFFTKNENPEQRFITQREKRWKESRRNISTTLAHIHSEEFNEQSKKKKNTTKKKMQNPPIQSKYINFIIYH